MHTWKNEAEAREQIKAMVAEYYHDFKEKKLHIRKVTASLMLLVFLMKRKCAH